MMKHSDEIYFPLHIYMYIFPKILLMYHFNAYSWQMKPRARKPKKASGENVQSTWTGQRS